MGGGGDFLALIGVVLSTWLSLTEAVEGVSGRLRLRSVDAAASILEGGLEGESRDSDFTAGWNAPGRVGLSAIGIMDVESSANIEGSVGLSIEGNLFSATELELYDRGLEVNTNNVHSNTSPQTLSASRRYRYKLVSMRRRCYPFLESSCDTYACDLEPPLLPALLRSFDL